MARYRLEEEQRYALSKKANRRRDLKMWSGRLGSQPRLPDPRVIVVKGRRWRLRNATFTLVIRNPHYRYLKLSLLGRNDSVRQPSNYFFRLSFNSPKKNLTRRRVFDQAHCDTSTRGNGNVNSINSWIKSIDSPPDSIVRVTVLINQAPSLTRD